MKRSTRRLAKCGFTLIELLVVIAIIALLAAILFPVFARARENARRSACQSNMKQILLGVLQYFQDYDEYGPCGLDAGDASHPWNNGEGWAGQAYPYIKSVNVFQCPDDPNPQGGGSSPVDYGYNNCLDVGITNNGSASPLAAMTQPAMTIMLTEGFSPTPWLQTYAITTNESSGNTSPLCNGLYFANGWRNNNSGDCYCVAGLLGDAGLLCGVDAEMNTPNPAPPMVGRHFNGSNFAFFDGHVKWLMGSSVSPGFNAASASSPQSTASGTAAGSSGLFAGGGRPQATYSAR